MTLLAPRDRPRGKVGAVRNAGVTNLVVGPDGVLRRLELEFLDVGELVAWWGNNGNTDCL